MVEYKNALHVIHVIMLVFMQRDEGILTDEEVETKVDPILEQVKEEFPTIELMKLDLMLTALQHIMVLDNSTEEQLYKLHMMEEMMEQQAGPVKDID